jgi:hypothetical protein
MCQLRQHVHLGHFQSHHTYLHQGSVELFLSSHGLAMSNMGLDSEANGKNGKSWG